MPTSDALCRGLLPMLASREMAACLFDGRRGTWVSRNQVRSRAAEFGAALPAATRSLLFIRAANHVSTVIAFLGACAAGHAALLVDPATGARAINRLIEAYRPEFIVCSDPSDQWAPEAGDWKRLQTREGDVWRRERAGVDSVEIEPNLLLLLSTSGTTGSQKFVRLSADAVRTNAHQIAHALSIAPEDVAAGHLPIHYSYGLSVITSHLVRGGAIALIEGTITEQAFWKKVEFAGCTHFPGVPFHYTALAQLSITKLVPASVKTFTQAGGALDPRIQLAIHKEVLARAGRLYVMYGQTEAAPQITTLPSDRLQDKLGSVGCALSGGRILIQDDSGRVVAPETIGNVVYEGPNVMMGYAENRSDLARGDDAGGRLVTGDLGRLDADGYLYLAGRTKRFAKLFGLRLSLDEVELRLAECCEVIALDNGETIVILHESLSQTRLKEAVRQISLEYNIPSTSFRLRNVSSLPRKVSGKFDYAKARELL